MSFQTQNLTEFTEVLASKAAVPGGGGASACVGAIGAALGNMVGALTVGKKTYADVQEEIRELMVQTEALRKKLLQLIDDDADCFTPLANAYSIPKEDPNRERVMEAALRQACSVPMEIMRTVCETIDLLEGFARMGSRIAISDAGVGAVCAKAALLGASLNVYINTKSMKDRDYALELEREAEERIAAYGAKADAVYAEVLQKIHPCK